MTRKLFSKNPIVWFKYALLVGVVFLAHWASGIIGLEQYVMTNKWLGWTLLFIFYYIFIALGDRLLEYILNVD